MITSNVGNILSHSNNNKVFSSENRVPEVRIKASKLQQEKDLLLQRLKEVQRELETLVTNPGSFTPPSVPSTQQYIPTHTPTYKPTLRPTPVEVASSIRTLAANSSPIPQSPRSPHNCKYNFTVYVYPLPSTLSVISISEEARRNRTLHVCKKCILEQFALEYIIYDFFTTYCNRVYDPHLADYFYLPLVRDAEFRLSMSLLLGKGRVPSQTEQVKLSHRVCFYLLIKQY
ncbi:hypothetical protein EON65_13310 [archaeon]|nr:MAG: hypothetical protein EON65_13310 [archaeon]